MTTSTFVPVLASLSLALACSTPEITQTGGDTLTDSGSGSATTGVSTTGTTGNTGNSTDPSASESNSSPTATEATATSGPGGSTSGGTVEVTITSGGTSGGSTGGVADAPIVVQGLSHPESILFDASADVYLISNINGAPDAVDDNGFIARVLPDGTIDALQWIDGALDTVDLDAPKGMALVGDTLYVADLTVVRKFDRVSGAPLGDIKVDGALFLNDLSADPKGNIYVSDTFADTLLVIAPDDSVKLLLTDAALAGPNGLLADDTGVHVVTYNGTKLLRVDAVNPAVTELADLGSASLDGLARLPGGEWLVTSWDTESVLSLTADLQTLGTAVDALPSPADIDVDVGRGRVLVPLLLQDRAELHPLP